MKAWYAVATKAAQEHVAVHNLERQSYEVYNPTYFEDSKYKPVFAGYIFTRFDPAIQSSKTINNSFGVQRLLVFGDVLIPVPDEIIGLIRELHDQHRKPTILNKHKAGDVVSIVDGIFAGIKAVYLEPNDSKRSTLMIQVLGSSQNIEIKNSSIA
jgi:transcriptional antiterminator RfaH